ncbi:MAG: DUF1631 domain-containing protein [Betaproteobacteria bacterium]|nr:MAG: DUF1631 domain-containing protein [Betaproteobacteria bacterium]
MPPLNDIFASAPARAAPGSTPFDGILEKCRDLISERLDDAISDMLDNADAVLSALVKDAQRRDERHLYEEARLVATTQREVIEKHFHRRYIGDFQHRSDRARKIGRPFDTADYSSGELRLVEEDDLEETLKFNDMANRLRAYCDEELSALDQRVGVLLGDANLETNDNPFSPQVICDAFKHACRELDAELKVRRVLLKLFDDHVLDDIRAVYKSVNALLVRNSILPQIRYSVARKQDSSPEAGGASAKSPGAALPANMTAAAAQDLFSVLQSLLASNVVPIQPGAGAGAGEPGVAPGAGNGIVVLQGSELLGALTRIQRGDLGGIASSGVPGAPVGQNPVNMLHEIKASSVGAGMGQLDLMTLDIIAMLFDELFDDPNVPNGVKGLIGRLQIPVLKVAIADKSFFSTKSHPARRLLDAVGDVALRLPSDFGDAHRLFGRLEASLQSIVEGFQDNLEIFTAVREQLLALMAEEDRRIEQETQTAAKRAEELENLALARSVAEMEVQTRIHGHELPAPVLEFLAQQWVKLLLLVYAREGGESAAWKDALDTVDQLVWSVEPKGSAEERRKLVGLVPGLIKRLTAGLKSAGIEDDVRTRFFGELMKCHTQVLGMGQPGSAGNTSTASAAAAGATADAAGKKGPASQASGRIDFRAPITVQDPFGGGEVKVDGIDLDFTSEAAAGARAKREASIRRALDNLQIGNWVEFRDPENDALRRPGRLIFISPRKSRYVFAVDRAGKEVIQCTRAEISHRLRMGDAVKLDEAPQESLFDRIMNALLGKLHMPGRAAMAGH